MQQPATFIDWISSGFSRADLLAVCALGVSIVAAIYTRRQSIEARRARLSAQKDARRPQRLEVYRTMKDFCAFCAGYYTLYLQRQVNGTRQLTEAIAKLQRATALGVIGDMPEVISLSKELQDKGWELQRHLDQHGQSSAAVSSVASLSQRVEAIEALTTQFSVFGSRVDEQFAPYLHTSEA